MDQILSSAKAMQDGIIAMIKTMVETESPSDDPASIARFAELFEKLVSGLATVRRVDGGRFGPHLQCEFDLPGKSKKGQILGLGHSDTVYPLGTLARMPFKQTGDRLFGPGVLDMKGGIAFFVSAMKILRDLNLPIRRKVLLQLNSDEEVGSDSSRKLTEKEAERSTAVLVLEPGTGLEGKAKTARKGVGDYTVLVKGKASHAGVDFEAGASAILELARQIEKISGFTNLSKGLTVNPGVISGGTRTNVVAAEARVHVDIRIARARDEAPLDRKFRGLKPVDRRCSIEVTGGLNRPPMERIPGTVELFKKAQSLAAELGVKLEESSTGGGSDGNFTAALGIPTLDGIGTVGEGAHAPHESILVNRIADRTALIAKLVQAV